MFGFKSKQNAAAADQAGLEGVCISGQSPALQNPREADSTLNPQSERMLRTLLERLASENIYLRMYLKNLKTDPSCCDLGELFKQPKNEYGNYFVIDKFAVGPGLYTFQDERGILYQSPLASNEIALTCSYGENGGMMVGRNSEKIQSSFRGSYWSYIGVWPRITQLEKVEHENLHIFH